MLVGLQSLARGEKTSSSKKIGLVALKLYVLPFGIFMHARALRRILK